VEFVYRIVRADAVLSAQTTLRRLSAFALLRRAGPHGSSVNRRERIHAARRRTRPFRMREHARRDGCEELNRRMRQGLCPCEDGGSRAAVSRPAFPIYTFYMFYTANLRSKSKVAGRGICEKDANPEEPLSDFRDSLV